MNILKEIRNKHKYTLQTIADDLLIKRQAVWKFENGLTKSGRILAYYLAFMTDEEVLEVIKRFKEEK